jgi:hypothetical protein
MNVKNDNNALPQIINSIIEILHPVDKENIIFIENHKGNLTVIFLQDPRPEVLEVIKSMWIYWEFDQCYTFKVVSDYKQI